MDEDICLFLYVHVKLQGSADSCCCTEAVMVEEEFESWTAGNRWLCSSSSERRGKREERRGCMKSAKKGVKELIWQEREQLRAPAGDIMQLYASTLSCTGHFLIVSNISEIRRQGRKCSWCCGSRSYLYHRPRNQVLLCNIYASNLV